MADDEQLPDPIANLDQTVSGQKDFAKIMRSYYLGLVGAGFTPAEALSLTNTYQTAFIPRG